jgi:uncharacterized protein
MNMKKLLVVGLWASLLGGGAGGLALAQTTPALSHPLPSPSGAKPVAKPAAAPNPAFREITWDELVPKDWDPTKQFKDLNMGMMSDSDPRAIAALKRMRETWDNAPTNNAIDGAMVRIPGYIVPLEDGKTGMTEFLLVPYFGACIHTPPPPSNQIIYVKPQPAPKGFHSMDTVWVSGKLQTLRSDTMMGASSYRMDAQRVEAYVDPVDKKR